MQYEVVQYHILEADSHEEAELKYRDGQMDIDQHQIFWYDEEGNRIEIPEEAYNTEEEQQSHYVSADEFFGKEN